MKILVLYFREAGNTQYIVEMVSKELLLRGNQILVYSIEEIDPHSLPDHDHLIF